MSNEIVTKKPLNLLYLQNLLLSLIYFFRKYFFWEVPLPFYSCGPNNKNRNRLDGADARLFEFCAPKISTVKKYSTLNKGSKRKLNMNKTTRFQPTKWRSRSATTSNSKTTSNTFTSTLTADKRWTIS